jgi:hypothetical protein
VSLFLLDTDHLTLPTETSVWRRESRCLASLSRPTNCPSVKPIDDILLVAEYMPEEEKRYQVVVFLPFRG